MAVSLGRFGPGRNEALRVEGMMLGHQQRAEAAERSLVGGLGRAHGDGGRCHGRGLAATAAMRNGKKSDSRPNCHSRSTDC